MRRRPPPGRPLYHPPRRGGIEENPSKAEQQARRSYPLQAGRPGLTGEAREKAIREHRKALRAKNRPPPPEPPEPQQPPVPASTDAPSHHGKRAVARWLAHDPWVVVTWDDEPDTAQCYRLSELQAVARLDPKVIGWYGYLAADLTGCHEYDLEERDGRAFGWRAGHGRSTRAGQSGTGVRLDTALKWALPDDIWACEKTTPPLPSPHATWYRYQLQFMPLGWVNSTGLPCFWKGATPRPPRGPTRRRGLPPIAKHLKGTGWKVRRSAPVPPDPAPARRWGSIPPELEDNPSKAEQWARRSYPLQAGRPGLTGEAREKAIREHRKALRAKNRPPPPPEPPEPPEPAEDPHPRLRSSRHDATGSWASGRPDYWVIVTWDDDPDSEEAFRASDIEALAIHPDAPLRRFVVRVCDPWELEARAAARGSPWAPGDPRRTIPPKSRPRTNLGGVLISGRPGDVWRCVESKPTAPSSYELRFMPADWHDPMTPKVVGVARSTGSQKWTPTLGGPGQAPRPPPTHAARGGWPPIESNPPPPWIVYGRDVELHVEFEGLPPGKIYLPPTVGLAGNGSRSTLVYDEGTQFLPGETSEGDRAGRTEANPHPADQLNEVEKAGRYEIPWSTWLYSRLSDPDEDVTGRKYNLASIEEERVASEQPGWPKPWGQGYHPVQPGGKRLKYKYAELERRVHDLTRKLLEEGKIDTGPFRELAPRQGPHGIPGKPRRAGYTGPTKGRFASEWGVDIYLGRMLGPTYIELPDRTKSRLRNSLAWVNDVVPGGALPAERGSALEVPPSPTVGRRKASSGDPYLTKPTELASQAISLILIGCVSGKVETDEAVEAKDLYTGSLWQKRRRYAEGRSRESQEDGLPTMGPAQSWSRQVPWAILSAKHGIVLPDTKVEPYDLSPLMMSKIRKQAWVDDLAHQLEELALSGIWRPDTESWQELPRVPATPQAELAGKGVWSSRPRVQPFDPARGSAKAIRILVLAGSDYVTALEQAAKKASRETVGRVGEGSRGQRFEIVAPLEGLGIGERMAWLKRQYAVELTPDAVEQEREDRARASKRWDDLLPSKVLDAPEPSHELELPPPGVELPEGLEASRARVEVVPAELGKALVQSWLPGSRARPGQDPSKGRVSEILYTATSTGRRRRHTTTGRVYYYPRTGLLAGLGAWED